MSRHFWDHGKIVNGVREQAVRKIDALPETAHSIQTTVTVMRQRRKTIPFLQPFFVTTQERVPQKSLQIHIYARRQHKVFCFKFHSFICSALQTTEFFITIFIIIIIIIHRIFLKHTCTYHLNVQNVRILRKFYKQKLFNWPTSPK